MGIMMKRISITLVTMVLFALGLMAQKDDPVLFKVEDTKVHVSEFSYIYGKTNGDKADFSKESIEEYLDLYVKFKLKVQKAKDLQIDTIPSLRQELEGYRRQLADSYLIDKGVADKLIKEAYDRIQEDVDISHILIGCPENAPPSDTLNAYNRIMEVKQALMNGADFNELARSKSTDQSAPQNGGRVGYVSALFPKGLYSLESAAYAAELNKPAGPVRTNAGYHMVLVHDRRPARGEMEAAHILIRKKKDDNGQAKKMIDEIYASLKNGADFDALAVSKSQDSRTANNKGYIGFFGINRYEKPFEDAAFSIAEDGAYSEPVETSVGWHIVKRISKKDIQPFNIEKSRLNGKIRKDPRFEQAKLAMLNRIKKESNFKENTAVLDQFVATLNDTFLTFRWRAPETRSEEMLFSLGDDFKVTLGDFTDYLGKASRKRLRMSRRQGPEVAAISLYAEFLDENLLKYEETQLSAKYPEFRALMREYEEGILLFETTKMLVWDKASEDTTGLREFFNDKISGKYRWGKRAVTDVYDIAKKYADKAEEIAAYAATHTAEEVKAKYNVGDEKVVASVTERTFEENRNMDMRKMKWAPNQVSKMIVHPRTGNVKFYRIKEILPVTEKKLEEARGYVVADYQDFLEKQWVEELQNEYKVDINKKVLKSLIKK
jgi:peptidyl-prolyl cis-trans isomerase SurA